jgi:hypothetical protein
MAALLNPSLTGDEANDGDWRRAELPAANGHGTARALVTVFGTLVDGSNRLISEKTLRAACVGQGRYTDLVLGVPLEFGLGFGLSGAEGHYGPNPAAFRARRIRWICGRRGPGTGYRLRVCHEPDGHGPSRRPAQDGPDRRDLPQRRERLAGSRLVPQITPA